MSPLVNFHPMEPKKWSTRFLHQYCRTFCDDTIQESRSDRAQLLDVVVGDLQKYYTERDSAVDTSLGTLLDSRALLSTSPEVLLKHRVDKSYAAVLRSNPAVLEAVIMAGMKQLCKVGPQVLYEAGLQPLVERWLLVTVEGEESQGELLKALEMGCGGGSRVCGRTITQNEFLAYCFECAVDHQCVLCIDCFQRSPCRNHRHVLKRGSGVGICDCGDPSAWRKESFCTRHSGFKVDDDPTVGMDPAHKAWLTVLFRGLIQYQLTVVQEYVHAHRLQSGYHRTGNPNVKLKEAMIWCDRFLRRVTAVTLNLANHNETSRRLMCGSLLEVITPSRPVLPLLKDTQKEEEEEVNPDFLVKLGIGNENENEEEEDLQRSMELTLSRQTDGEWTAFSCLELIHLIDLELGKSADILLWRSSILYILDSCITDPLFRFPYAELLARYSERLALCRRLHVESLQVQVLTVREVVDMLLCPTEPYPICPRLLRNETILHRQLSALLISCIVQRKQGSSASQDLNTWHISRNVSSLLHILTATDNAKAMVTSRILFRAWCLALSIIGTGSVVRREHTIGNLGRFHIYSDYASLLELYLFNVMTCVTNFAYTVGLSLQRGEYPIPNWLREVFLSECGRVWPSIPDISMRCQVHRCILDATSLPNDASPMLCPDEVGTLTAPHRAYMREILLEMAQFVNTTLSQHRKRFVNTARVVSGTGMELWSYNLIDPNVRLSSTPTSPPAAKLHSTSFVKPHLRFFSRLATVWAQLNDSSEEPWSRLIEEVLHFSCWCPEHWIDACVMPFVLVSQIERGLWLRDDRDVSSRAGYYVHGHTLDMMETDLALMQLLLVIVAPEDYAAQLLLRHSYRVPMRSHGLGYASFLRLILTLCVDECGGMMRNQTDLHLIMRRLLLHTLAIAPECTFKDAEIAVSELHDAVPGVQVEMELRTVLEEVAVMRPRSMGRQIFELKDATVWREMVNLYHPIVRDYNLLDLHDQYLRLVRAEQTTSGANVRNVSFPPPTLRWFKHKERQQSPTDAARMALLHERSCLLLQTSSVLSVAIYILHQFLQRVNAEVQGKRERSNTTQEEQASNDSLANEEEDVFTNSQTLMHAVVVLYLATHAAAALAEKSSSTCATGSTVVVGVVDWAKVAEQQRRLSSTPKLNVEEVAALSPIPGLASAETLLDKLRYPVHLPPISPTWGSTSPRTTITVLREIVANLGRKGGDKFGISAMIKTILVAVGEESAAEANENSVNTESREWPEEQRRRRMKEKQEALLRRARAGAARSVASITQEIGETISAVTTTKTTTATSSVQLDDGTNSTETEQRAFLTRLLLCVTDVECCMCRDTSDETLFFFANTSTTDVLARLQFRPGSTSASVSGTPELNVHFTICGHAAHRRCVSRACSRVAARLLANDELRSIFPHSSTEIMCPICLMICTIIAPFPYLATRSTSSTNASALLLFEAVRRGTVSVDGGVRTSLHKVLLRASVGLHAYPSDGELALRPLSRLALERPKLAGIVAALRALRWQMCVALEWVKAGGKIRQRELLGMLSLMLSIAPKTIYSDKRNISSSISRDQNGSNDYNDDDVTVAIAEEEEAGSARRMVLLFHTALRQPREADTLIATYTEELLHEINLSILLHKGNIDNSDSGTTSRHVNTSNRVRTEEEVEEEEGEKGSAANRMLVALWRELGCLTLLQLLLSDAMPDNALVTQVGKSDECRIVPLEPEALSTLRSRRQSVQTMLCHLLHLNESQLIERLHNMYNADGTTNIPLLGLKGRQGNEAGGEANERKPLCVTLSVPYGGPLHWRHLLLSRLFHHDSMLASFILRAGGERVCSVCGDSGGRLVTCCYCARSLCEVTELGPHELRTHAHSCGNGFGPYFCPSENRLLLITLDGRSIQYPGLYADEFGDTNTRDRCRMSQPVLSDTLIMQWLSLWIRSRWGVESSVLKKSKRVEL